MSSTVSVICPTHNRADFLKECIDSVLASNRLSAQVIVVDDGSTDHTIAVCNALQGRYGKRLLVSRTERNYGAQVARNRGMALASGHFILFLDSDDVMIAERFAKLVACLEQDSRLDYVFGSIVLTDCQLTPLPGRNKVGSSFDSWRPRDIAGYHWSIMGAVYRRAFLERVGNWNEQLTGSQDWEYQARVKIAAGRWMFIDEVVGYARQHAGERVGTKRFRPDYCQSEMVAFQTVLRLARAQKRCDAALEARLAKKMALVGLEWGANGYSFERGTCLAAARSFLSKNHLLRLAIYVASVCPRWADGAVWRYFAKMGIVCIAKARRTK